jgi:hypothetical protein
LSGGQREQVGGPAVERRGGVEAVLHLGDEGVVGERHMNAHLAERVISALRRDAVENGAAVSRAAIFCPEHRPSDAWHPRLLPCVFRPSDHGVGTPRWYIAAARPVTGWYD